MSLDDQPNKKVRPKSPFIIVWFLLVILVLASLFAFYQYQSQVIKNDTRHLLKSASEAKVAHIESWLEERQRDIFVITQQDLFVKNFLGTDSRPEYQARIEERLEALIQVHGYGRISLLDEENNVISDLGELKQPMPEHTNKLIEKTVSSWLFHSQLFWHDGIFHFDAVTPILDHTSSPVIYRGSIVFHVDPSRFLVPFIESLPFHWRSGKSELLYPSENGGYQVLSASVDDMRFQATEAVVGNDIFEQLDNHPLEGETALLEYVDIEGEKVLAYHQHLTDEGWVLLTSVTQAEVMAPLYRLLVMMALIGALALALVLYKLNRVFSSERARLKSEELEKRQNYFMGLFMNAPTAYQSLDEEGHILDVNQAWSELFGYQREEVLGKEYSDFIHTDSLSVLQRNFPKLINSGHVENVPFTILRKDGTKRAVSLQGRIAESPDRTQKRTHCMLVDITEQQRSEKALRLAAKVFNHTGEGLMVTQVNGNIVSINEAFTKILGYQESEVLGKKPNILRSGKHDRSFYKTMWSELMHHGLWQGEIWNRHKDGRLIPEWLTVSEMRNEQGKVENYIGVFADISKLKASQAELDYLAHHDVLTQLPNRRRFMTNIEYAITHAKRDGSSFAVLMLDLDRFKDVNDSYGHSAGDEVLINVAQLLRLHVREVDMVARLGGDEFVVLLENLTCEDDAARIARNIINAISDPQTLADEKIVSVGCSIGITLFPDHGEEPEHLMQHADSALYLAKQKGRGTFEYFSSEMTEHAQQRMAIESELKSALKNNELRVFYQPQIDMESGKVKGAESLVRWQHPKLGLVSPAYFIGIAEESGLIAEIGEWVLNETCRQAKKWRDQGCKDFVYAVNVSPKQMAYTDLFTVVMSALAESGLPAEQLELEMTESGLMVVGEEAVRLFERLRGLGVRIAIDDFGTGYSSLAYLKSLPLDVLKVDKQFVDDIPNDEQGMQIVNTIISMAHNLRLEVLAEGVEESVQKQFLEMKGCNYYQGYLTSPPVPADKFETQFLP